MYLMTKNQKKFAACTGIKGMYKALPNQTASDLAYAAVENLIEHTGLDRNEIGLMVSSDRNR